MDLMMSERAKESEKLINELEKIYLFSGWRDDTDKRKREKEIKNRLRELLK